MSRGASPGERGTSVRRGTPARGTHVPRSPETVRTGSQPMRVRRLQSRFLLAGGLLVGATVFTGLWSAWTFARLTAAADEALHGRQATIDRAAELAGSLEREDDALLLALEGDVQGARSALERE